MHIKKPLPPPEDAPRTHEAPAAVGSDSPRIFQTWCSSLQTTGGLGATPCQTLPTDRALAWLPSWPLIPSAPATSQPKSLEGNAKASLGPCRGSSVAWGSRGSFQGLFFGQAPLWPQPPGLVLLLTYQYLFLPWLQTAQYLLKGLSRRGWKPWGLLPLCKQALGQPHLCWAQHSSPRSLHIELVVCPHTSSLVPSTFPPDVPQMPWLHHVAPDPSLNKPHGGCGDRMYS